MDYSKSDWKLFRERIGDWQKSYIKKLNTRRSLYIFWT